MTGKEARRHEVRKRCGCLPLLGSLCAERLARRLAFEHIQGL